MDHWDRSLITFLYIFQRFFNTISLSRRVKFKGRIERKRQIIKTLSDAM